MANECLDTVGNGRQLDGKDAFKFQRFDNLDARLSRSTHEATSFALDRH